jgi:hypothetical protein
MARVTISISLLKFSVKWIYKPLKMIASVTMKLVCITQQHFCACPKPGSGFTTSYVAGFFCVQWVKLRWEVVDRSVDIGGIDAHHCLNILFIINKIETIVIYKNKCSPNIWNLSPV